MRCIKIATVKSVTRGNDRLQGCGHPMGDVTQGLISFPAVHGRSTYPFSWKRYGISSAYLLYEYKDLPRNKHNGHREANPQPLRSLPNPSPCLISPAPQTLRDHS
ncbi:hypothetical protein SNK03_009970 [Fusarium graminearum]